MKFKREIFRRELFEGEKIPFGWGVAYPEWNRHAFILYPWGIHIIVGLACKVYYRLTFAFWSNLWQETYDRGFHDGVDYGAECQKRLDDTEALIAMGRKMIAEKAKKGGGGNGERYH